MADGDIQERPRLAEPRDNQDNIRKIFENPKIVQKLKAAVPRHLNPERMLRVMSLAVQKTPKLLDCNAMSLLGGMQVLASLGLEPNTPLGHAYLIPFDKRENISGKGEAANWVITGTELNVIIGYKGFIDLARRTGMLVSIHADVVYGPMGDEPGDEFSFEYGSNMHIRHRPIGDNEGRPPIWAYAHASLKDGQAFEVLPYARVLRIRDAAEGYKSALRNKGRNPNGYARAPWVAFEHEMSSKTMIRRLSKYLQMSIEFANAVELDALSETGQIDLGSFADGIDLSVADVNEARRDDRQPLDETRQLEQSSEAPMNVAEKAIETEDQREAVTVEQKAEPEPQQQTRQPAPEQKQDPPARQSPPPAQKAPGQSKPLFEV